MEMTSRQLLNAMDWSMEEAARRLKTGELDGSGRFYSDAELAAGAAAGKPAPAKPEKASAA
jgi:hypothetical protein